MRCLRTTFPMNIGTKTSGMWVNATNQRRRERFLRTDYREGRSAERNNLSCSRNHSLCDRARFLAGSFLTDGAMDKEDKLCQ
jgi:hypothetical protein